jgi:hypothetical protein
MERIPTRREKGKRRFFFLQAGLPIDRMRTASTCRYTWDETVRAATALRARSWRWIKIRRGWPKNTRENVIRRNAVSEHARLDNRPIEEPGGVPNTKGAVECRERVGGVLKYYYRRAA